MTEVKAEVPMAEMLDYAPDLRAITGGRGDYTMEFARYEEVPAHLAQKVIAEASRSPKQSRRSKHDEYRRRSVGKKPLQCAVLRPPTP